MSPPAAADVPTTYRSAVDGWVRLVLGGAPLVAGVLWGIVIVIGDATARAIAGAAGALGVGLPLWVLTSTSYTLTLRAPRRALGPVPPADPDCRHRRGHADDEPAVGARALAEPVARHVTGC